MIGRFILIALVNLGAYGILRALWPDLLRGGRRWTFLVLALLSLAAWAVPLALGLGNHGTLPWVGAPLKLFSTAWVIGMVLVVVLGLPVVLLRWGVGRRSAAPPLGQAEVDVERRSLLVNAGRAVPLLALGTSSVGIANGSSGFEVRQVEVKLRGLPPALEGFRIGQITDVHVGTFINAEDVRGAVAAMNEAGVDLQVMTGDLIDDLGQLDETMAALEGCRAPHGMLAVLGNHEHWRGLRPILSAYSASARRGGPVRLLRDSSHVLEHAGQRIRVVGVDYPMGGGLGGRADRMRHSAELAFSEASPEELVLCLSHHPSFFPFAAERGARLTLAGHTHGGQVALLGIPVFGFVFEFMLGRYRRGDNHLYVSGGTGHWLPFRLGVPAEVSILTLRGV